MSDMSVYVFYLLLVYLIYKIILNPSNCTVYYAKFGFYIITTQIVCAFFIPIMALSPRNLWNGYLIGQTLQHVTKVMGVTWELRNEKVLIEERGAVVIANHQSFLDILGLYNISHATPKMAPVCKKELLYMLPFGLAAYLTGCIFIDRKKPYDAHNTLKAAADSLFKNKSKIFLFPEGTRNKNPDKLQPFKKGAFSLAISCQVPIIPLVISRYYFIDTKYRIFKRGHAIFQCLEAVPTQGMTMDDLPDLINRVQKMMEDTYENLGRELVATLATKD